MKIRWYDGQNIDFNHINHKYNCLNYWKIEEVLDMLQMSLGLYDFDPEGRGAFVSIMSVGDVLKECDVKYKPAYFLFSEARGNSVFYYWKNLFQLNYDQVDRLVNYIKDVRRGKTFIYEIAGFETGGGL